MANDLNRHSVLRNIVRSLPTGLIVLSFGVLLSLLLWSDIKERQQGKKDAIFIGEANRMAAVLVNETRRYVALVQSTVGLFKASQHVSYYEFEDFLKTIPLATDYPGVQGIGFAKYYHHADKVADETILAGIYPEGERDEYAPIEYFVVDGEPVHRYRGFDILTEPVRKKFVLSARDQGQPQITGKTFLPTKAGEVIPGVYIFSPWQDIRSSEPTLGELRKGTQGFVFTSIDLQKFYYAALGEKMNEIVLKIYSSANPALENLVFNSHAGRYDEIVSQSLFTHVISQQIGAMHYTIVIERLDTFNDGIDETLNDVPLFAGLTISVLAFILTMFLMNARNTAEVMARNMTRALDRSQNRLKRQTRYLQKAEEVANLGHWRYDPETNHFEWSDQLFAIHKWKINGLVPLQSAIDLIQENDQDTFADLLEKALRDGKPFSLVTHLVLDNGDICYVQIRGEAELDADGNIVGLFGIYVNETDRVMSDFALAESEEQRSLAVEGASVGLWDWEISTGKLYWSTELLSLVGLDKKDFIPKFEFFEKLIHEEDRRRFLYGLDQHIISGQNFTAEYRLYKADGTYVWVQTRARAIRDDQNIPIRISGTTSDITDWKRAEAALVQAQHEANAANKAKSDFLAMMSHELRTPMTGIMGMIELLKTSQLQEEQRNYLNKVGTSAEMLLTMLNDVLDLSKIESGKFDLEEIDFATSQVCDDVKHLFDAKAKERGNEICIEISDDVPDVTVGDPVRIRQILFNLVSNAIKFTSDGSITLRVKLLSDDVNMATLGFEVEDTGIGLSREQQRKLFQPYVQAESSISRRFGGTGLGLAICKQLTEAMHGEIGVKGEQGVGTTFWFSIQLPVSATPLSSLTVETDDIATVSEAASQLNILVAEDNDVNRELLDTVLSRKGHNVTTVRNGEEAVDIFRELSPDVILMDIQMPIMDGEAAAQAIRSLEIAFERNSIPIVALTADVLPEQHQRYREEGFSDVLDKPIDWNRMDKVLASIASKDALAEDHKPAFAYSGPEQQETIDRDAVKNLVSVLTKDRLQILLNEAIDNARVQVEELLVAIDENDRDEIKRHCHTMRGMTGNFGLTGLYDFANEIEAIEPTGADTDDILRRSEELMDSIKKDIASVLAED